jgi:acyl-coenzyme A thioesterase PaaI-like protein
LSHGFLFARVGGRVTPTPYTRGPWDPGLLHGGAVGALFAESCQEVMDPAYTPVRLTVDLMKPVPLREMGVDARVVRTGRRLQLIEADLRADGTVVARATLLALRPVPLDGEGFNPEVVAPTDGPADASDHWGLDPEAESFIGGAMDFRFILDEGQLGGGVAWFRLRRDVFDDGRPPSPLARAAAASDVGGAVSARRGGTFPTVSFINADISVHLARAPEGEWIRLTSSSSWEPTGIGAVASELSDPSGPFGRANQALVLELRRD